jgi:hypothetical protein
MIPRGRRAEALPAQNGVGRLVADCTLARVVTARTALYEPAFFGLEPAFFGFAFFGAGGGDYSSSEGRVRGRKEASPEFAATDEIAVQLVKLDPKLGDDGFVVVKG